MGFNLGAALSGAAEGASDTYFKLKEQQRRDAEMKQRQEMHDAWKREQLENEQLKALAGETYGRVDTPEAWKTAGGAMGPMPEGEQTALPADAAAAFPAQKLYARDQAAKDFQARAMGINPMKAMDYETKALQTQNLRQGIKKGEYELTALERSSRLDAAFESYMAETHQKLAGMRQEIQGTFDTDGMNGLVKKYGSDFKDATGNSVALVGNALVIKDSKGKVVGQPVTRPEDAVNALSNVIGKKAMESSLDGMLTKGLFRTSAEMMDYFTKRSTMRTQEATAAAATTNAQANMMTAGASVQNAATNAQLAVSHAALYNAQAAMSAAHADLFRQSIKTAENNQSAKEAMQPYLDQIAQVKDPLSDEGRKEVEKLTLQAVTAGAKHSADMVKMLNELKKPDRSQQVDPEIKKAAYKELSEIGTNPKDIAAVKAKWPEVFGMSETDKAVKAAEERRKNPQAIPAAPAAPVPATNVAPAPAAPTSTVPAAALPASAPAVTKSTAYGKTGYQIKGVIGVFSSPEEAQAAWVQKYAPKAPAGRFD